MVVLSSSLSYPNVHAHESSAVEQPLRLILKWYTVGARDAVNIIPMQRIHGSMTIDRITVGNAG
jgi:hypothetical protein